MSKSLAATGPSTMDPDATAPIGTKKTGVLGPEQAGCTMIPAQTKILPNKTKKSQAG
jgi:hypothetical protein